LPQGGLGQTSGIAFHRGACVGSAGTASAIEPCHRGVPTITIDQGNFAKAPGTMDPDAETLHPDGKLQEQRWRNLHTAIRPLKVICHYANKVVSVTLPETIDTCVWEHDERRVRCF